MSKLQAFLKPITTDQTKDVCVSNRFQNEDGTPATFTIRAITQDHNNLLIKQSTRKEKVKGQIIENLNKTEYQKRLVLACAVEPDFTSKELCDVYGVVDPMDAPGKMLFAGEYAKLIEHVMDINGFKDEEELADEAKNS